MLRATVLLLLVTSSTLARILTPYNEDKAEFPVIDCAADYAKMNIDNQKLIQKGHPNNTIHSLCVRADGHFVATVWSDNVATFTYMFDACGWREKKIEFPNYRIDNSGGCTFSKTKLFYSDTLGLKLHQYSLNGTYEGVFASGKQFLHQTVRGNLLYTTINIQRKVYAYDMTTKKIVHEFETTNAFARDLAFDSSGLLHISTWSGYVEIFNAKGVKQSEQYYPQVRHGDGIIIDKNNYTLLVDRISNNVYVYTDTNALLKTIYGFKDPTDIAMGFKCGYLLVADLGRNGIFLL